VKACLYSSPQLVQNSDLNLVGTHDKSKHLCISITVFEEQDFWGKLHYKLPHKKMQRIQTNAENAENPNQAEIELEPFVNGVNHKSV